MARMPIGPVAATPSARKTAIIEPLAASAAAIPIRRVQDILIHLSCRIDLPVPGQPFPPGRPEGAIAIDGRIRRSETLVGQDGRAIAVPSPPRADPSRGAIGSPLPIVPIYRQKPFPSRTGNLEMEQ